MNASQDTSMKLFFLKSWENIPKSFLLVPNMLFLISKWALSLSFHNMINNNLEYKGYIFKDLVVGLFFPFYLAGKQEPDFFTG